MKVHHLNCGTMHPVKGPECVCHVLLLETDNGLVLVDSGFGIDDCADPKGRIGPVRFVTRPVFEVRRVRRKPTRQDGLSTRATSATSS